MSALKQSLVGLGSRLLIVAVSVVNTLLLARLLGPQDYGRYIVFIRVVAMLTMATELGLSQSANAFVARYNEWIAPINRILLRFVIVFAAGATIIGAGLFYLAGHTLLPNFSWRWAWLAFAILPMSVYANIWYNMMIGMGRIWGLNLMRLLSSVMSLILILVFIVAFSGGVSTAVMIYLAMMSLQFVAMIIAALLLGRSAADKPSADLSVQMLRFGLRGYFGALFYVTWVYVPIFFLNAFHGPGAVGILSAGQQIVDKALLGVQAVQDVVYKKMAVLPNRLATLTLNRYLRVTWWGMVLFALAAGVLAPWGISVVLGERYASTGLVARVLLLGTAFMSVSMLFDTYFINQLRRPGLVSILAGVNVVIALALALLLIPTKAAMGAAWTLALTQVLGTVIVVILYLRITRTPAQQLVFVDQSDVSLVRAQMGTLLWRK